MTFYEKTVLKLLMIIAAVVTERVEHNALRNNAIDKLKQIKTSIDSEIGL